MATLVPGSRIGAYPYQIVKALDDNPGNMSEVYLASVRAPETGEESLVVLKVALGSAAEHHEFYKATLENEVERLRRLKHPGIVRVFPVQREGLPNLPYLAEASGLAGRPLFSVMEFLSGGSLTGMIDGKELDIGAALEIARNIAGTLDYLHNRRQVHLDLKPDNVLFRARPEPGEPTEPVLIDFGIARDIGQSGLTARTLHYASPERVAQQRHPEQAPERATLPHPAMDVYALGVTLYEMLTGSLPFQGRSTQSLTSAILKETPRLPSTLNRRVNRDLDALVMQMLDKEPARRPTAEAAAMLLDQIAISGHYRSRYPNRAGLRTAQAAPAKKGGALQIVLILTVLLLALLVFLEFVWIVGTAPYWSGFVDLTPDGLRELLENIRRTILP